jgi:hypothetical protein
MGGGVARPGTARQQLAGQAQHERGLADLVGAGDEKGVSELP